MSKATAASVKAELDTLTALSQERFIELLSRVKRLRLYWLALLAQLLCCCSPC